MHCVAVTTFDMKIMHKVLSKWLRYSLGIDPEFVAITTNRKKPPAYYIGDVLVEVS